MDGVCVYMFTADHMNARPCLSLGWMSLLPTNWSWLWYSSRESIPHSSRLTLDTDCGRDGEVVHGGGGGWEDEGRGGDEGNGGEVMDKRGERERWERGERCIERGTGADRETGRKKIMR